MYHSRSIRRQMWISLGFWLATALSANGCSNLDGGELNSDGETESSVDVGFGGCDAGGCDTWEDDVETGQWSNGNLECPEPDLPLEDEPPIHNVVFEVINDTDVDQYLAIEGYFCDAFSVGVPHSVGLPCPCACDAVRPQTNRYVRLAPSESYELTWDGREVRTYVAFYEDCSGWGIEPRCGEGIVGNLFPSASGTYELEILVTESLPDEEFDCLEIEDTVFCDLVRYSVSPNFFPSSDQAICPDSTILSGWSFELPESGDLTVSVQMSEGLSQ